jgi:hypothetical protein
VTDPILTVPDSTSDTPLPRKSMAEPPPPMPDGADTGRKRKRMSETAAGDAQPTKTKAPRVHKKCPHGRQKSVCKDCGGCGICQHGRRRNSCKDCGVFGICIHGRYKYVCKDCRGSKILSETVGGGVSICEHGRLRRRCKECGGSQVCEHQRIRSARNVKDPKFVSTKE